MHRIAAIEPTATSPTATSPADDGRRTLTLRGDANRAPDVETYTVDEAERVVGSVGATGYVLTWLGRPEGLLTTGALVALALLLGFGPPPADRRPADGHRVGRRSVERQHERPALRRGAVGALVVVLLAGTIAAGAHTVTSSRAAWTDQGTAASGTFTAHTVLAPATAPVCTDTGVLGAVLGYVQLTWPHRDTRYSYTYTVTRVTDSVVVATGTVTTAGAAGSTVTLNLTSALITGVLLANTNFDVTIRSALSASPTWVSAGSWVTRIHSVNIVLLGLSLRCGPA